MLREEADSNEEGSLQVLQNFADLIKHNMHCFFICVKVELHVSSICRNKYVAQHAGNTIKDLIRQFAKGLKYTCTVKSKNKVVRI